VVLDGIGKVSRNIGRHGHLRDFSSSSVILLGLNISAFFAELPEVLFDTDIRKYFIVCDVKF
jgi:hypothetical protein